MYGISLYCMVLHVISLYCMILNGIAWYCIVLHGIELYCIKSYGIAWYCIVLHCTIALWGYPHVKWEIENLIQITTTALILLKFLNFSQNYWRLPAAQFHFWIIFGSSWTQSKAEEGLTIDPVSIQAGWRKDVNKLRDKLNAGLKTAHQIC